MQISFSYIFYDCYMDFLGETIDIKLCETLEEVFRRVRFRSIDIEATGLDEDVSYNSTHQNVDNFG